MLSLLSQNDNDGIHLYHAPRDQDAITEILIDNFNDVISNNYFDFPTTIEKISYAQAIIASLPYQTNTTIVMRKEGNTIGYLHYGITHKDHLNPFKEYLDFPGLRTYGNLYQLAMHHEYQGKKYGKLLCLHAIKEMEAQKTTFIQVATTTEQVGRKFYHPILGFEYYGYQSNTHNKDIWYWRKYCTRTIPQQLLALTLKNIK